MGLCSKLEVLDVGTQVAAVVQSNCNELNSGMQKNSEFWCLNIGAYSLEQLGELSL